MIPRVVDLSHHNVIPEDLLETAAAGVVGLIHKITEGTGFIDDKVQARHFLAKDAGMAWGLYHFLRPGDMQEQARFFIDTAQSLGVIDDKTLLAADHEDADVSYGDLLEFLAEVERLAERSPVIYSGHVLKDQCESYPNQYRLWLAQYADEPELPAGCEDFWLWQYSDRGSVPGITPPTDVNYFEGDDADFLSSWPGRQPTPKPGAVEISITIDSTVPVVVTIAGDNVTVR